MSDLKKCDFCKKEIKWMTPFYQFEMRYSNYTDKKTIDICSFCYKKFIKSVKTEALGEVIQNDENEYCEDDIELLTDTEQRIFLKAMSREREVCQKVDDGYSEDDSKLSLVKICNSIERKVKKIWE